MSTNDHPVILSAVRTPIGAFGKGLSSVPAHALGAHVIGASLQRAELSPEAVDEVVMGQILTAGQGQNPARQAAMKAGVPSSRTAYTLNQVCGSGLRAVALASQAIRLGDASVVVAGGQENMSLAQHSAFLRNGLRMGNGALTDTMISDGLWDAFNDYHMGITAENVAERWEIGRDLQDEFAVSSQNKAEAAIIAGRFKAEIAPYTVKGRKGDVIVEADEHPRAGTTLASVSRMRPAFKKDGSVTAANASGINDGAAAVVVASAAYAAEKGLTPMARIVSWATAGVDPEVMGTGPVPASKKALEKAGWTVADLDLVEANEAFAAQACVVNKEMGWDPAIVNVNGGAIALGHPIGASGCRILVTLLHEMIRRDAKRGLATLCIGGGMGIALCVER